MNMKLIIFSDLHYTTPEYFDPHNKKLSQFAEPLMKEITKVINDKIKPDACVFRRKNGIKITLYSSEGFNRYLQVME